MEKTSKPDGLFGLQKSAFSLIEILISLIIISLLVAAFAPIITKKLKASDISIGSFGSGSNVNMTLERQVTKEDCDKYDAIFIPAAMNGGVRNLCVTKYNMGDNELPLADSVKKLTVGNTCTDKDKGNCCWNGSTSTTCTTGKNGNGDYSGCNRTVCQWSAANASCANYAPNSENEGSWRLPSKDELNNWSSNLISINNNKGQEGLQLCDATSSLLGSNQCNFKTNGCPTNSEEGTANGCYPDLIWSLSPSEDDTNIHYANTLANGAFNTNKYPQNLAFSTRCVLDSINVDISELPNGGGIKDPTTDPFYGEPASQEDCDKVVGIFIDKKMSGANRNICVSKYNVGDAGPDGFGPPIPESFTQYIMSVGQTCPYNGSCCWKGKTSDNCGISGNAGANYSGCNRTVCQFQAANAACRLYNAFGATAVGAWRLPTQAEFSVWQQHLGEINNNKGADGLQFCTAGATAGYVQCGGSVRCVGAVSTSSTSNRCHVDYNWTETAVSNNTNFTLSFPSSIYNAQIGFAASARCVYDGITKADNYSEDLSDYDDSNAPKDEPKSQADCDKLTAIFVHKKYAGGMRNLCISKYNVGDSGPSGSGPTIPSKYNNYIMSVGQTCPYSGFCCWKGKTSDDCGITGNAGANYSGCNRTTCQQIPATESCLMWTAGGKTSAGAWRLPTQAELTSISSYLNILNNNRGKDGLQFCTAGATAGYVQCGGSARCVGAVSTSSTSNRCHVDYNWTETAVSNNTNFTLSFPSSIYNAQIGFAASARCVYDGTVRKPESIDGYDDSNAPNDEPKSQADCDKLTAIFVHKKYAGGMRNLCISKYNVGDSGPSGSGPTIPLEYRPYALSAGQTCSKAGHCCWSGKTSDTCGIMGNAGADYGGCSRTVCQFNVANAACKAYTSGGKTQAGYWRLPTNVEYANMKDYLKEINNNRGKDGLQFCTAGATAGYVQCGGSVRCVGAVSTSSTSNRCHVDYNWTETAIGTNVHYTLAFPDSLYNAQVGFAASARCVYDGQKY